MTGVTWLDGVGYGRAGFRYRITDDRGIEVRRPELGGWVRYGERGPQHSGPGALADEHDAAAVAAGDNALDPNPFIVQYPDGSDERAPKPPLTSRIGWRFAPRRGYAQTPADYPAPAMEYAHLRRNAGDPATLSERIDTIEAPSMRMQQQDEYDHDPDMVALPLLETLPLDPEPWAWRIGDHDAHTDQLTHDGLHG